MKSKAVSPSTMTGIKRLARQLKAAQGLSYSDALTQASKAAGFTNFRHAQKALPDLPKVQGRADHDVYLTAYWREGGSGQSGRETLVIRLPRRWTDLLSSAELRSARGLENFSPEGSDHLSRRQVVRSQNAARESVCHAARTLQFVAATGLRPSSGYCRAYPKGDPNNKVPGQDHVCIWFDANKRYLIADEPYEQAVCSKHEMRRVWCQTNGYSEEKPSWPGMHNPFGGTRLFLVSNKEKGVPLGPIIKALEGLPTPHSSLDWKGDSKPRLPYFMSPGSVAKGKIAPTATKSTVRDTGIRHATLGYTQTLVGPRRRPNGRMPVAVHRDVGSLLKEVLVTAYFRKSVYSRLNSVRSDLDEWTMREYDHSALPDEEFFNLYYHEIGDSPRRINPEIAERCVTKLQRVHMLIQQHYPDCAPLRRLRKLLTEAEKALRAWGSAS